MNAKRIIIEGKQVHHVGYRPFLLAKARRLGIRNFEVDNVEEEGKTQKVIVSVSGNEKQVKEFAEFVKTNHPKEAKVSKIKEVEPPKTVMPIDEFDKTLAAEQQDTIVRTGLMMLGKQDKTLSEIHAMRTDMNQNFAKMDEKQDQTITEIKTMTNDMNQNFDTLNKKYGSLSERMASIDNTLKELGKAILTLAGKKS